MTLDRAIELLRLERSENVDRDAHHAPVDAEVRAMCERLGYGAVMHSAARQWRAREGAIGAFTVGMPLVMLDEVIAEVEAVRAGSGDQPR